MTSLLLILACYLYRQTVNSSEATLSAGMTAAAGVESIVPLVPCPTPERSTAMPQESKEDTLGDRVPDVLDSLLGQSDQQVPATNKSAGETSLRGDNVSKHRLQERLRIGYPIYESSDNRSWGQFDGRLDSVLSACQSWGKNRNGIAAR